MCVWCVGGVCVVVFEWEEAMFVYVCVCGGCVHAVFVCVLCVYVGGGVHAMCV